MIAGGSPSFNIAVPTGDPSFEPEGTGTRVIPTHRSTVDDSSGTATPTVGQKVLRVTFQPRAGRR